MKNFSIQWKIQFFAIYFEIETFEGFFGFRFFNFEFRFFISKKISFATAMFPGYRPGLGYSRLIVINLVGSAQYEDATKRVLVHTDEGQGSSVRNMPNFSKHFCEKDQRSATGYRIKISSQNFLRLLESKEDHKKADVAVGTPKKVNLNCKDESVNSSKALSESSLSEKQSVLSLYEFHDDIPLFRNRSFRQCRVHVLKLRVELFRWITFRIVPVSWKSVEMTRWITDFYTRITI